MPKKPSKAELSKGAQYHTRYVGPSETHGARIIVTRVSTGKRRSVPYDYAAHDAHESAVHEVMGSKVPLKHVDDGKGGSYWQLVT